MILLTAANSWRFLMLNTKWPFLLPGVSCITNSSEIKQNKNYSNTLSLSLSLQSSPLTAIIILLMAQLTAL